MKQKITIMKKQLDLSDEEINRYMDFDTLRKKQNELDAQKRNQYAILKWSVPILLLVSSVIWFYTRNDNNLEVSNSEQQIQSEPNLPAPHDQKQIPSMDSVKSEMSNAATEEQIVRSAKKKNSSEKEQAAKSIENSPTESTYIQAEPVDGYASLYTYLNAHLQYPAESVKDSIQGVQTISFVINVEGKPDKIQFIESLGAPFERESKRLIESMPAWKPATLNGKPVPSKLVLPLTFQIQKIKVKE